jgi:hypothetical protein
MEFEPSDELIGETARERIIGRSVTGIKALVPS